jgi:hypothetical protein
MTGRSFRLKTSLVQVTYLKYYRLKLYISGTRTWRTWPRPTSSWATATAAPCRPWTRNQPRCSADKPSPNIRPTTMSSCLNQGLIIYQPKTVTDISCCPRTRTDISYSHRTSLLVSAFVPGTVQNKAEVSSSPKDIGHCQLKFLVRTHQDKRRISAQCSPRTRADISWRHPQSQVQVHLYTLPYAATKTVPMGYTKNSDSGASYSYMGN